jgi:hypothetical protein
MNTEMIAKAIVKSNEEKGSYIIRFLEGNIKGMYLGWSQFKAVKTKRSARTTICQTNEMWKIQLENTPFTGLDYEIICLKKPNLKLA